MVTSSVTSSRLAPAWSGHFTLLSGAAKSCIPDTPRGAVWSRPIDGAMILPTIGGAPVKICFFHLMPYRFLPDDFETRYRSVWVDVPHSLYDAEKTHGLYNEFLDELEFAEQ